MISKENKEGKEEVARSQSCYVAKAKAIEHDVPFNKHRTKLLNVGFNIGTTS